MMHFKIILDLENVHNLGNIVERDDENDPIGES